MAKTRTGGRNAPIGGGGGGIGNVGNAGINANLMGNPVFQTFRNAVQSAQNSQQNQNQQWADMTDVAADLLRRQLGQSGYEAGQLKRVVGPVGATYIQSAKSYLVNNALNSDMQAVSQGYVPPNAQGWLSMGYNINDAANTIKSMDSGMKPLVSDTKFVRYEGGGDNGQRSLELITGIKGLTMSKVAKMSQAELNKTFVGMVQPTKQYLSTSWRMDSSSARDRAYMQLPIRKEYLARTGTEVIMTKNITEHETVFGRGYDQTCVGARMDKGQLVLSMVVDPSMRSGYYKIK